MSRNEQMWPLAPRLSRSPSLSPQELIVHGKGWNEKMMDEKGLQAMDTHSMPWEERLNERVGKPLYRKDLIVDPDTGMEVRLVRYPAGFMNPRHTHPHAHGLYVLEGTLVTHEGRYGPGHFLWFPEGMVMEHGATPEADVTVLFITNKPFVINYEIEEKAKVKSKKAK